MRFLIDADLPRATSIVLASYQHDAIDVRDIGMRYADDKDIAAYALSENLCILSGDWGFSDIRIYPPERYHGIVVIGLPAHSKRAAILAAIEMLMKRTDIIALLPGRLAIFEKNRIRLRPSP